MTKAEKPAEQTAMTVVERASIALGYAKHEAELVALAKKSADIVEIKNVAGREQCHSAMMSLANTRTSITKTGKAARDDANAFSKAVIAVEKRLIELIEPEEIRLRDLRDQWDEAREAEKRAKAEAEQRRIAAHRDRIDEIRGAVAAAAHADSALILEHIGDVERLIVDATLEEFQGQAQLAKDETLDKLREMHRAAVAREEEAARIKAEQEAEAARLAAERLKLAQEKAEQEAEARAAREAQEKVDAAVRAELEAQQAELRKQQEEVARQQAEVDRQREEAARQERERLASAERLAAEAKAAKERKAREKAEAEAKEQARRERVQFELNGPDAREIIAVLAEHYGVEQETVLNWINRWIWADVEIQEKAA